MKSFQYRHLISIKEEIQLLKAKEVALDRELFDPCFTISRKIIQSENDSKLRLQAEQMLIG